MNRLKGSVVIELQAVDADFAVVARIPTQFDGVGTSEPMIDDIPVVGSGPLNHGMMPRAPNPFRAVFGEQHRPRDPARQSRRRIAYGIAYLVVRTARVVLRPREIVFTVAIENICSLIVVEIAFPLAGNQECGS